MRLIEQWSAFSQQVDLERHVIHRALVETPEPLTDFGLKLNRTPIHSVNAMTWGACHIFGGYLL